MNVLYVGLFFLKNIFLNKTDDQILESDIHGYIYFGTEVVLSYTI